MLNACLIPWSGMACLLADWFLSHHSTANTTGTQSVHTKHKGHEIMFHVSTLLRFYPSDPQQVGKRTACFLTT